MAKRNRSASDAQPPSSTASEAQAPPLTSGNDDTSSSPSSLKRKRPAPQPTLIDVLADPSLNGHVDEVEHDNDGQMGDAGVFSLGAGDEEALMAALVQEHGVNGLELADVGQEQPDEGRQEAEGIQVDERRLERSEAARLLVLYEAVVAGNSQLEQILEQGFVLPSDHEPGQDYVEPETNLRDILSSSDPLRSTVESAIEILSEDSSSLSSSVIPSRVPPQESTSSTRSRHLASFGRSALQLLNALDEGPQGRGLARPKRKVALVMKTPGPPGSSSTSGFGNRWFTDAVELDEEEEFDATGYADLVEIHDTPKLTEEDAPKLGQSSVPRVRKVVTKHAPIVKDLNKAVHIIPRDDPFASFLPSHDSSVATLSLTDSIARYQKISQSELYLASGHSTRLQTESGEVEEEQREKGLGVQEMLDRNWRRLADLREKQIDRLRRGVELAEADENATAEEVASTLAQLIALRPPALLPSSSAIRSLQSLVVGQSAPPRSWRGTLDPTRPLALADNMTVKVVSALPPPPPQQQVPHPGQLSRQGSYNQPPPIQGYRPSPPPSVSTSRSYGSVPGQAYSVPSRSIASPALSTGSPYGGQSPYGMAGQGAYGSSTSQVPPQWQSHGPQQPSYGQPLPASQVYVQQTPYGQPASGQESAPIPMMGWKTGTSTVSFGGGGVPEGMW